LARSSLDRLEPPGFQRWSNQGCRGVESRRITFQLLPGLVWTQFDSCPTGAFGPNHDVTKPSACFCMAG
jgi:hypothetical protein